MRVQTGRALFAAVAATALAVSACSSSGGGNKTPSSGAPASSGGSSGSGQQTAGTKGTGNLSNCATATNTCNSGTVKQGGTLVYGIEKTVAGWNLNNANSNVFDIAEAITPMFPTVFPGQPDLSAALNTDLMASATQTKTSPQTLVYKIKPTAVWDDGTPLNFADFKYAKDTSDGTTCPKCGAATTAGYNQIKTITGSNGGKTVTVVMKTPFADWKGMFGPLYPAHIAAKHGGTSSASGLLASFTWFDKHVPTYPGASAGPYKMSAYQKDTSITEVPNPKWYGAVKPSLTKLVFRIITDQTQQPAALQNNEVQALYSQPSADLVANTSKIQGVSTYLGKGLIWEHLSFNEKNQFLSDVHLRTAIFTAVSRKDIIARTVGQFVPGASPLGNHIYVPGQPGYTDNVTSTGQGSGDLGKAKQILTDAGYKGVGSNLQTKSGKTVTFRCTFSAGNTNRQQICEIVQATLKKLGINVKLKTTPDLGELGTGNYDLIVFAWVGTPFVVPGAQQIYELKGGSDFGANNDPAAEKLINQAASSTDPKKVQQLLNQADVKITADAYELPLFQKPTFLAAQNNIVNIRDNATATGPSYNYQSWGIKK